MHDEVPPRRPATLLRSGVAGLVVGLLTWAALTAVGVAVPTSPAHAAAVPVTAATDSAYTVKASEYDPNYLDAPFPDLEVTVSQTDDLVAQGVTLTWSGGSLSTPPSQQTGGADFLQIAQCWGEDPNWPGHPDRTTCQYGGLLSNASRRDGNRSTSQTIAPQDAAYTAPAEGRVPAYTSIPFQAYSGEIVASVEGGVRVPNAPDVNNNAFFTQLSTNEIPWAGFARDGSGLAKFEVQTVMQSAGLGCGAPVTQADQSVVGRSCWLVIIPRGQNDQGRNANIDSGLYWDNWKHHVAIPLDFRPVGVRCAIGAAERQVAGSELAARAVSSWQPALCGSSGGSIYSQLAVPESDAARSAATVAGAPLALVSLPGAEPGLSYAPIALTGLAVGFAVDHSVLSSAPDDKQELQGQPITQIRLTPRLIAKLLTYSYIDSLPAGADLSHLGYRSLDDQGHNARNLFYDPEFRALNPDVDWTAERIIGPGVADLLIPQGRSDAALTLWQYVLADQDARAFLAGTPDPSGMIVNPWYSTDAAKNPSGTAFEAPRDTLPKADPVERPVGSIGEAAVNLVTWRPYTNDLEASAYLTLRGDAQVLGGWDPTSLPPKYVKTGRELLGNQKVLGLTTLPAAERYQVFTAALLNPAGQFVTPTTESLTAAAAAMTALPTQPQVLRFDPASAQAKAASTAYPLAIPVYAAARTDLTDVELRGDYAEFIRYAVGAGQVPGETEGLLPRGYAPIPDAWKQGALATATKIAAGPQPASSVGGQLPTYSNGFTGDLGTSEPVPTATDPLASGEGAGDLAGPRTPNDGEVANGSVVPVSLLAGLGASLASTLFARRRRLRT